MTAVRKLVLLLVAAASVLSAQAQMGQSDADRRMRNREQAMEQRLRADREGGTSVPPVVTGTWRHGRYMNQGRYLHHGRMHMHRHHLHRHHLHRHPVR